MIYKIKEKVKIYKRNILPETERLAAVLFPLILNQNKLSVILTKRSGKLPNHSGEISFPGGMFDLTDKNLLHTALRETEEEIGIQSDLIEILGTLDDEISLAGHRVTPFLGFVKENFDCLKLKINEVEVEKVLCVPFEFFFQKETYWNETWIRRNKLRKVHFYLYEQEIIWGLTARMINKLINL